MTRKQALEEAIGKIAHLCGMGSDSLFAIIPLSPDPECLVIMSVRWPEGERLCRELKRTVRGFPEVADASCVALLPEVADGIIAAAQAASAAYGRDGDGTRRATSRPIQAGPRETDDLGGCNPVTLP